MQNPCPHNEEFSVSHRVKRRGSSSCDRKTSSLKRRAEYLKRFTILALDTGNWIHLSTSSKKELLRVLQGMPKEVEEQECDKQLIRKASEDTCFTLFHGRGSTVCISSEKVPSEREPYTSNLTRVEATHREVGEQPCLN
ncbi:unnamed protein product [Cyprideis torosa]|uniref:Uncharacterized protein n=1 Tax=Cyprideis torosa TaxID=163714 RepID=A0A7R8ZFP9_9CRUS|nr:unnamed protein product [Cyprideis torosa]CAG0879607.1 unnamed protein product [Cyprideis torosa]